MPRGWLGPPHTRHDVLSWVVVGWGAHEQKNQSGAGVSNKPAGNTPGRVKT